MKRIEIVGVVGCGQMGAGIAQVSAVTAECETLLYDLIPGVADKAFQQLRERITRLVEKGTLPADARDAALARIQVAPSLSALNCCDLVVEAVKEDIDVKHSTLSAIAEHLSESAVLASNTSSISITKLASGVPHPHRVIGMHFMNPVPVMALVEVIRGLQTDDETHDRIKDLATRMQKKVVLALDAPGFIVNRILVPMVNEAIFLLQQGVAREDIDTAMKLGTNQPMGPLELADFVGLDTLLFILQVLHRELGEDKYRPCPLLVKYVEAGWVGKKSGRGFYSYERGRTGS